MFNELKSAMSDCNAMEAVSYTMVLSKHHALINKIEDLIAKHENAVEYFVICYDEEDKTDQWLEAKYTTPKEAEDHVERILANTRKTGRIAHCASFHPLDVSAECPPETSEADEISDEDLEAAEEYFDNMQE